MKRLALLAVVWGGLAAPAQAYVDVSPTLGTVIRDSGTIVVLQVDKVSKDKRVIIYKKVADLKGKHPTEEVRHQITDGLHAREPLAILDWAIPGQIAVCFHNGKVSQTCIGHYWYESAARDADAPGLWWSMTRGSAELSLAYFGRAEMLRQKLGPILAGQEAVITAIRYTEEDRGKKFVVMGRGLYRGKDFPVWRIKASLKMPGQAYLVARTAGAVVGPGAGAPEDVPGLVKGLQAKEPRIRQEAAADLGLIGPPARAAMPALLEALKDEDRLVRVHAAEALARIEAEHSGAIFTLIQLLGSDQARVRQTAAYALGNLGPEARAATPELIKVLKDADISIRGTAAETLGRIGPAAAPAVPALTALLNEPALRGIAADALGGIGPDAKSAIPELTKLVSDADVNLRWTGALALVRIDPAAAKPAVPVFVQGLRSGNERFRLDAIAQLSAMGPAGKEAAPTLTEMTRSGDILAAATLVAVAGTEATAAIPVLIPQLPSDAWDVSGLLAAIGPASVPPLIQALQTTNGVGSQRAASALGQIGRKSKEVAPALIAGLSHKDPHARIGSAQALGTLDPKAVEAVPGLTVALKDDNVWVRLTACSALRAIAPETKEILPFLQSSLQDAEFWARRSAAQTLGDLGAAAKPAIPTLTARLKDADAGVRAAAARALLRLQAVDVKATVPILIASLKDKDAWTRQQSAVFLGEIGPPAAAAVPALQALLADASEEVRTAAAQALKKVQGK